MHLLKFYLKDDLDNDRRAAEDPVYQSLKQKTIYDVGKRNLKQFELVLRQGASLNPQYALELLYDCLEQENVSLMHSLLDYKPDLKTKHQNTTVLHYAHSSHFQEGIRVLEDYDRAWITERLQSPIKGTPGYRILMIVLLHALVQGNLIVPCVPLIENELDVNQRNKEGKTPLHIASQTCISVDAGSCISVVPIQAFSIVRTRDQ
ncbi:hypothetical protein EDD86DRAFT_250370 [Gorgonomyces haynaldii]|nr:hypothetical protein EDD86DRAFT_250370 [Gorgonomyces haynaldii]